VTGAFLKGRCVCSMLLWAYCSSCVSDESPPSSVHNNKVWQIRSRCRMINKEGESCTEYSRPVITQRSQRTRTATMAGCLDHGMTSQICPWLINNQKCLDSYFWGISSVRCWGTVSLFGLVLRLASKAKRPASLTMDTSYNLLESLW
jgi:hypothetical protein